jgi:hypothetical protein
MPSVPSLNGNRERHTKSAIPFRNGPLTPLLCRFFRNDVAIVALWETSEPSLTNFMWRLSMSQLKQQARIISILRTTI